MIWRIGLGLSSAGRVGVRTEQELLDCTCTSAHNLDDRVVIQRRRGQPSVHMKQQTCSPLLLPTFSIGGKESKETGENKRRASSGAGEE